jgi:glucose/arabinose dehydrogenase
MLITGSGGADRLLGTPRRDGIAGRQGDDVVFAASGSDRVRGGAGDDRIAGGEGRDRLDGGRGDDAIFGFGPSDRAAGLGDIVLTAAAARAFDRPVFAAVAPGEPGRLFVVEQHSGRILILDLASGRVAARPFLDLPDASLADGGEQGLLGLAFHPGYARNGRFFVHLTQSDGDVEVRAYRRSDADPDRAAPGSANTVLTIDRDNGAGNHNGGWIGFGPDRMLYVAVGDEGLAGDPANNAQDPGVLWGKLLRLDVGRDGFPGDPGRDYAIPEDNPFAGRPGADEVWALGLRNPWRAGFDRATGDLYIGDVGQGAREEIDFQPAGRGGVNYGWKVKEGELVFDGGVPGNPAPGSPRLTDPVASYPHDASGGFAVVGGYVYRGESGGMQGRYLYADFVTDQLWSLRMVGGRAVDVTNHTAQLVARGGSFEGIASFAEDARGNLYAIGLGGAVSRLSFGAGAGDAGDRISGGAGDDRLFGGAGDDRLFGGPGRDRLAGGGQDDRLTGGAAADRFVFAPERGADRVTDFADDVDTLVLRGFGFASAAEALARAEAVGGDVVFDLRGGQQVSVADTRLSELADDLIV